MCTVINYIWCRWCPNQRASAATLAQPEAVFGTCARERNLVCFPLHQIIDACSMHRVTRFLPKASQHSLRTGRRRDPSRLAELQRHLHGVCLSHGSAPLPAPTAGGQMLGATASSSVVLNALHPASGCRLWLVRPTDCLLCDDIREHVHRETDHMQSSQ